MKTKNELFRKIVETHGRASLLALLLLLLLLLCPIVGMAQSNITISNFAAAPGTDGAPTTITFNIEWAPPEDEDKVWSDTVWVFVDYNNAGTMTRLPLAPGATLTKTSWEDAQVMEAPGNDQGVWVVGNARANGSFSANVQLLVETWRATSLHGLCIYAINYPPVGRYTAADEIQFNGTPPFYLTLNDESSATLTKQNHPHNYTYTVTSGNTVKSFTDASRAPGVINCKTPATQTLQSSATTYCADAAGVTLSLSGTEKDAVYRLIKEGDGVAASITGEGSPAAFIGTFGAGTYHVETVPGAFCPVTLTSRVTVTEVPLPAITHLSNSGSPTQSVTFGASLTDIKFITTNASSVTVSGLPAGLSGTWASNTLTISGNLSALGATTYTISTANLVGCSNQMVTYALKGNTTFADNTTFTCNSRTWSSFVYSTACTTTVKSTVTDSPYCFTHTDGQQLYNVAYWNTLGDDLCPDGWRLPTSTDIACGTNTCRAVFLDRPISSMLPNGTIEKPWHVATLLAGDTPFVACCAWGYDYQGLGCGVDDKIAIPVRCVK